jgi:hypothetical protein
MKRLQPRYWIPVALAFGLVLVVLMLQVLRISALAVQAMSTAGTGDPTRYCYTWQASNDTGQDANGVHVRLQSIAQVSQVYTGTYSYFTPDEIAASYDSGGDVYRLDFTTETVGSGESPLLGLCSDHSTLALAGGGGSPFYFTVDNVAVQPDPAFIGLDWNWLSRTSLRLGLINPSAVTVTLQTFDFLDPGVKLALEDLNSDVTPALDPVSDLTAGEITLLPPGTTTYFTMQFDSSGTAFLPGHAPLLEPNHPYVVQANFASWDDPDNNLTLISQALSPPAQLFLPIISK